MKIIAAVIGTGIGSKHIEAIDKYRNSHVTIVCENDNSKFQKLKKKFPKKKIVSDYKDILKVEKNVNFISIASYDHHHFEQLKYFIKYNKFITVEKPMVLSYEQLKIIDKMISKYKTKLISNLVLREVNLFKKIKSEINKKKVYYLEGDYLWGRLFKLFGWRSKSKNYSITLGAAIHIIDLFNWFLNDKPTHVYAVGNNLLTKGSKFKGLSLTSYFFKYKNGIIAKISANAGCIHPHFHEIKIFQKDKTIVSNLKNQFKINNVNKITNFSKSKSNYPDKKNRKKIIRGFIDAILDKKKISPTVKYQIDLMKICFAAEKFKKFNKEIKIQY